MVLKTLEWSFWTNVREWARKPIIWKHYIFNYLHFAFILIDFLEATSSECLHTFFLISWMFNVHLLAHVRQIIIRQSSEQQKERKKYYNNKIKVTTSILYSQWSNFTTLFNTKRPFRQLCKCINIKSERWIHKNKGNFYYEYDGSDDSCILDFFFKLLFDKW